MSDNIEQEEDLFINDKRWKTKLRIFAILSKPKKLVIKPMSIDLEEENTKLIKQSIHFKKPNKDQLF